MHPYLTTGSLIFGRLLKYACSAVGAKDMYKHNVYNLYIFRTAVNRWIKYENVVG